MNVPLLLDESVERGKSASLGFVRDFKTFMFRTSLVQFAVGVIVGGAIQSAVTAFATDLLMPPIALLTGQV